VNRFLSPGGRVTLLNSVLSVIPIFSSWIHEDVCKGVENGCDGPNKGFCGVEIMDQLRYLGLVGRMSASLSVMGPWCEGPYIDELALLCKWGWWLLHQGGGGALHSCQDTILTVGIFFFKIVIQFKNRLIRRDHFCNIFNSL